MEIKTLENTPFAEIVACFNQAFADYVVPITATEEAMRNRWTAGRVDYRLSAGVFERGKLVAFIITGTDNWLGRKTAYNAGTGVIPQFRGQKLVARLYDFLIPLLKQEGITQCTLEVIRENEKAIKAYQNVGFTIDRTLHCFKGEIQPAPLDHTFEFRTSSEIVPEKLTPLQHYPFSWDNTNAGINRCPEVYVCHQLLENETLKAYALLNPETGYLAQVGFSEIAPERYGLALLKQLARTTPNLRINNIASGSEVTLNIFRAAGFTNHVTQYEMRMLLN